MLSYRELYDKVAATLQHDHSFRIEVGTWRHSGQRPKTLWEIYVPVEDDESIKATGNTAQEAFDAYLRELSDQASLEDTSAAVGTAEVEG